MESYARLSGVFLICIQALVLLHSPPCNGDKEPNCSLPEPQHSIINKTSGSDKVLACSSCRECNKGNEPEVPCPSILGISESHGGCKKCGEGMFSSERDTKACKKCRYQFCMEQHLLHNGTCTHEKDNSYCIQRCAPQYVMNKERTKCEAIQPHTPTKGFSIVKSTFPSTKTTPPTAESTFPSTKTTSPTAESTFPSTKTTSPTAESTFPSTKTTSPTAESTFPSTKTTSPTAESTFPSTKTTSSSAESTFPIIEKPVESDDREDEGSKLPISVVIVFVIIAILILAGVVFAVYYRLRASEQNTEDTSGEDGPDLHNEDGPAQIVKYSKQGSDELNHLSTVNGLPFNKETTPVESALNRSDSDCSSCSDATRPLMQPRVSTIKHGLNEGYISNTPSMSSQTLEQSSDIPGPQAQPTRMTQEPQQIAPCVSGTGQWEFENLSYKMYRKICLQFDNGAQELDSLALAGWLGLESQQVWHIQNKNCKTDEIMKMWMAKDGNDVKEFIRILEDNKMSNLAGEILRSVQQHSK